MPDPSAVIVYAIGLCSCSACAPEDLDAKQVADAANKARPTGIASRWAVSRRPFRSGQTNPCACNTDPSRRHWLLEC